MPTMFPEVLGSLLSAVVIGFLCDGMRNAFRPFVTVVKSI